MLSLMKLMIPFLIIGSTSAYSQVVEEMLVAWSKKCGPLSGKTPDELPKEDRRQCEEIAARANKFFRMRDGGGFAVAPAAAREMSGRPLRALSVVSPCNKTAHNPKFAAYLAKASIPSGGKAEICTNRIPHKLRLRQLTCEVHGGGTDEACANNGDFNDCSWAATVTISSRLGIKGNRHCWWVYNQADSVREFSISIKR